MRTGPGRGAWLCRDSPECLEQALRRRAFERALAGSVGPEAVEGLRKLLAASRWPSGRRSGAHDVRGWWVGRVSSAHDEKEGP